MVSSASWGTADRQAARPAAIAAGSTAAWCIAALVMAAFVLPRSPVSLPGGRRAAHSGTEVEAYGSFRSPRGLGFDSLRNTSRLSDEELRYYFEGLMEEEAAEILDQDRDGIADGTRVEVMEFIERMKIILSDRMPFVYRVKPQGLPIIRGSEL